MPITATVRERRADRRSEDHGAPPSPPAAPPPNPGGGSGDGETWTLVPVASFGRTWEAELARGALEADGIEAVVDGAMAMDPYPSLAAVGWAPIRVLVPEDRLAEAWRLLTDLGA